MLHGQAVLKAAITMTGPKFYTGAAAAVWAQDFIFVGQGATATNFGVVPDKQANGCCASDHKPIVAEVSF